jgi:hypothetical protein
MIPFRRHREVRRRHRAIALGHQAPVGHSSFVVYDSDWGDPSQALFGSQTQDQIKLLAGHSILIAPDKEN